MYTSCTLAHYYVERSTFGDKCWKMLQLWWQGLEAALTSGAREVAIFTAASESFTKANTNCTIEESLQRCRDVCGVAVLKNLPVRG